MASIEAYPDYTPPSHNIEGYHCPYSNCGVYSKQNWYMSAHYFQTYTFKGNIHSEDRFNYAVCDRCDDISIWRDEKLLYPIQSLAPRPHKDMPDEVINEYKEAREIFGSSPRASAALLR